MTSHIAGAAFVLAVALAHPAGAVVIERFVGADLTVSPYTIDLGTGSITFSTVDPSVFSFNPTGVQTSGSAQIFSLGAPFYSQPTPTSYFTESAGGFGPGQLGFFAPYASPTAIPFSIADGLVGFGFTLADGFHYGVAQLGGSVLSGFRYETRPDTGVPFGAIAAVPEPATWAMLILGFAGIGASLRRRHSRIATGV